MSGPSSGSVPKLRPGCRLSEAAGRETMLMIPEGALRLIGPGLEIVKRCDGERNFFAIVDALTECFPGAGRERIEAETAAFLESLRDKRALDY